MFAAHRLARDAREEDWVADEIALAEPAWLPRESEEPFDTESVCPGWSAPHHAGGKIEKSAHSQTDAGAGLLEVLR